MPKNKLERRLEGVKRAKRVIKIYNPHQTAWDNWEEKYKYFGRLVHTRVPCSCGMCGNPRRDGEITRQEKFIEWEMQEELKVLE